MSGAFSYGFYGIAIKNPLTALICKGIFVCIQEMT